MSTSEKVPAQADLLNKGNLQKLEKLIGAAFAKLRNLWRSQSAQTGIQFYFESDD